jgi:hypothetical protein
MKKAVELSRTTDPGWPLIQELIQTTSHNVTALPTFSTVQTEKTLEALQVTTRSFLGAVAYHTGGIAIDYGWLRFLGSGTSKLVDVVKPNTTNGEFYTTDYMIVAYDVLGGIFALDGGGLGSEKPGNACYFSPDGLEWEDLGLGYGNLLEAFIGGLGKDFYTGLRWANWEKDTQNLELDQMFAFYPFLSTSQGGVDRSQRAIVPVKELLGPSFTP